MPIYDSITELIGNTPLLRYRPAEGEKLAGQVLLKLENFNPLSSVKDRIGLSMIRRAEKEGQLLPGAAIVEATSGNTGIALAYIAAATGHPVYLTMPDTMSIERRRLLKAFGAKLVLTPGNEGMGGAVKKAEELAQSMENAMLTRQFENPANPEIHRLTTAKEIWEDSGGNVDIFVAGVGTGGTLSGAGGELKKLNPELRLVAVEPEGSPVISGGKPGPHKIQGIGAGFIPGVLDTEIIDEVLKVSSFDAGAAARKLAAGHGVLGGISAGANLHAALEIAGKEESRGKTIVTVICDSGERYLSTWLFDD